MRKTNTARSNFFSQVRLFTLSSLLAAVVPGLALSQEDGADDSGAIEEIVVQGTRRVIQDSIALKRNAVEIVDGLDAADIGDLPALSIGEALETMTGVASHRENGGATEVSIRGLGPFLSNTTFNGREASNGSGDRSVNFSQFPSELMSKLEIYKTQDASLIEGGVAGLISLETLRPLNYGKRRFQFDLKGSYAPDQSNLADPTENDIGYRGTLSYVDQFEFKNGADFGISLGYQNSDISQPEQEVRSSSPSGTSLYACINDPSVTYEGYYTGVDDDCEDQVADGPWDPDGDGDFQEDNQGYVTQINPATGLAYSNGQPYAFAPSSRGYRQNDTSDERQAFFTALQYRTDNWDINFDAEFSERTQAEQRHDLNFANMKRNTAGVTGPSLIVSDTGAVSNWLGETAIESNSEIYDRTEKYAGGGLEIAYNVNDRLTISADLSYSKTTRVEQQISLRTQSDNEDIFDVDTPAGYRPLVNWNTDSGIPQYTLVDFDVNDPTLFSDEYRVRIDSDVDRTNEISAIRGDFSLDVEWGGINGLEGGLRYSELEYLNLGGTRYETGNLDDSSQEERDTIAAINQACANSVFPESDFLSSVASGNIITNIDSATGQPTSGTGNTWATFDTACVMNAILAYQGTEFAWPEQTRENPNTTDVTETTLAGYLMANFEGELVGKIIRGNFGVRVVNTNVESVGYRTEYEIIDNGGFLSIQPVPGADLERVLAEGDYTEALPSVNAVMDLTDDVLLRGAIYRGMSRADPGDLGYNRSFELAGETDITDPDDLIADVSGAGNPNTKPLMSWNYDLALEWYPNEDTILAAGVYYKQFTGGFEPAQTTETFIVDGQPINATYVTTQTTDKTSDLWGIEVTVANQFTWLPGWLAGFGTKLSYNYADSNFEFQDSMYGDVSVRLETGELVPQNIGILAPGNVPGFSDHVFSGQLYYQIGDFDAQLIYKYRSEYFQPYTSNGTRLRYIGDVGVWEARVSYLFGENFKVTLEGINLFDEPKSQYFFARDNLGEVNVYGSRLFLGFRAKF